LQELPLQKILLGVNPLELLDIYRKVDTFQQIKQEQDLAIRNDVLTLLSKHENKKYINLPDEFQRTPLEYAILLGYDETTKALIENKAQIRPGPISENPHDAALFKPETDSEKISVAIAMKIIKKHLIHIATFHKNLYIVEYLVKILKNKKLPIFNSVARVTMYYTHDLTPMHIAAYAGASDIMNFFIQAEGFPQNQKCLHAQTLDKLEVDAKFSENPSIGEDGDTPLHIAARNNNAKVVQYLCNLSNENTKQLGQLEQQAINLPWREQYITSINQQNAAGDTPLHCAVKGRAIESISTIVSNDPNTVFDQNKAGDAPIHVATKQGDWRIAGIILSLVPNKSLMARNLNSETILHLAISNIKTKDTNSEIYNLLLSILSTKRQSTALNPINLKDKNGDTALHLVLTKIKDVALRTELIQLLLQAGAKTDIANNKNITAEQLFKKLGITIQHKNNFRNKLPHARS
jgi:Ankyrin repeat.